MMQLENLTANFQGVQIKYTDIVNYEIARENICGYIFLLSRISKNADGKQNRGLNLLSR